VPSGVARGGGYNAVEFIEWRFHAPEAAAGENGRFSCLVCVN